MCVCAILMCKPEFLIQCRCFLMNDYGYLVAHKSLFETTGKGPLEQEHVTHLVSTNSIHLNIIVEIYLLGKLNVVIIY